MFAKPDALVPLSKEPQQVNQKLNRHDNFIKSTLLLENSVVRTKSVCIYVFHVWHKVSSQKVTSEYMSSAFSIL